MPAGRDSRAVSLDVASVEALVEARHSDPFSVLGLHADEKGTLCLRVLLPGARCVSVLDAAREKIVAALALRDAAGLWEGPLGRRRKRFDYRLAVQWSNGDEGRYADAYAFGPTIGDADLHYFGEGTHLRPYTFLGAHPMGIGDVDGVRFAVWAPNAARVEIIAALTAGQALRGSGSARRSQSPVSSLQSPVPLFPTDGGA